MTKPRNFHQHSFISGLGMRMFLLLVFSLILMNLDHRLNSLEVARKGLSITTSPIQYAVDRPLSAFRYLIESLVLTKHLQEENAELKKKQLLLSVKLQKFLALESENAKLRALLQSAHQFENKTLTAQLLSVELSPFSQQVILNKGSRQGVFVGQPVLDEEGVMGQVMSVTPFTSRVLLMTDKLSAIPVQINRNGLRAIATGYGKGGYLSLLYVPDAADIKVGDLLVTSGLGKHFPFGYPVGTISQVKRTAGEHYIQVLAKPSAGINRSRQVLLLWPNFNNKSLSKNQKDEKYS